MPGEVAAAISAAVVLVFLALAGIVMEVRSIRRAKRDLQYKLDSEAAHERRTLLEDLATGLADAQDHDRPWYSYEQITQAEYLRVRDRAREIREERDRRRRTLDVSMVEALGGIRLRDAVKARRVARKTFKPSRHRRQ